MGYFSNNAFNGVAFIDEYDALFIDHESKFLIEHVSVIDIRHHKGTGYGVIVYFGHGGVDIKSLKVHVDTQVKNAVFFLPLFRGQNGNVLLVAVCCRNAGAFL